MEGEHTTGGSSKYWGNIAAGMLPIAKTTCRMMIQKRGYGVNWGGTWGIIGGAVGEYGEFLDYDQFHNQSQAKQKAILVNAAKNELMEEVGSKIELLDPVVFHHFPDAPNRFDYYNMACFVNDEFKSRPMRGHEWESLDHQWVTLEELYSFGKDERFKGEKLHPKFAEAIKKSKVLPKLIQKCRAQRS